ncbi:MAG: SRPBCC domain-containing protein [Gemmatimonadaceae bacterium]
MGTPDVVVERTIPMGRERVFDAWLNAELLAIFMRPTDATRSTAEVDARVGGKFRIVMAHGGGEVQHWGEYLEITRPSRLVFTWISANTDERPTTVTVELTEESAQRTRVVLTHRGLPDRTRESHRTGWTAIAQRLAELSG